MKLKKRNIVISLLIVLAITISFLPKNMIFSKAEEVSGDSPKNGADYTIEVPGTEAPSGSEVDTVSSTISLTSSLWDTNQYSGGTGIALTEEGATVTGWQSETSKYLQIDPVVPSDGNTYKVTVKLPQEFYIVGSELATPAGYQKVEFTKNESIKINDSISYNLNTYSGTAVYTLNHMGVSGTIQLELGYDVVLWNKQAGATLTPDGVKPIEVILTKIDSEGTETEYGRLSVSKATAGTGNIDAMSMNGKIEGESTTASSLTVPKDKRVLVSNGITNNEGRVRYKYYTSMDMTINLPYYTDSEGTKHYIPIDTSSISTSIKYESLEINTDQISDGIITAHFEKTYWSTGTVVSFYVGPLNEELEEFDISSFAFKGGRITTKVNGKNGTEGIQYGSIAILNITYQKESNENVVLTTNNKSVTLVERPENAVSILGGFYLENTGTGDSCAKTIDITFDINDTNLIKVTTVNTFADTVQEYIDIKYTLVDEDGKRVYLDSDGKRVEESDSGAIGEWTYSMKNSFYGSTSKADLGNKLTRAMLPEAHRTYYFKTMNYTIDQIESLARLFAYSATSRLTGSGNFIGYVDESAIHGQTAKSSIVVTSSNPSIATLTKSSTTTLQTTSNPTYLLDNLKMNKTTIQAGESVTTSGTISTPEYPYGNSTWLKGITIGALLPKDVSINEQSIVLKTATGKTIEGYTVSSQDLGNGNVLWKIKLPDDVFIGMATENLGKLPSGITITYSMQLDTSYTMNGSTLFAKNIFMVAGYKQTNSASGSYAWGAKTDTYDLNENEKTTDIIGGAKSTDTTSCQIVSQTATLDISDSITIERQGSVTQEAISGELLSKDDIVNYNLDIGCFSGGRAEGFSYFIPIPKTISEIDGFLIDNSSNGKFEFNLKEFASISGSDIYNIEYIFEEGITYAEAQNIETWYTEEEITNDNSLNIEDATMIKLTLKGEGIQNGDQTRVSIKLVYAGTDYEIEAGMENIWHSGGYYKHINSDRESAGNFSTDGVSVKLKYSMEAPEITLTAAKEMKPQIGNNTNATTVEETEFPTFKNAHSFYVTEVETYNVTLQTKDYIQANTDMPGIDANRTFAITVTMPDGTEKDILTNASTVPIQVGTTNGNRSPEFTYKLYNADALTDNAQARYIIVTLTSDNGVMIKQKININREIAQASDPKSAIVAGKRYLTYDDTTTGVVISQDSAFTAQFIFEYIPEIYSNQIITFSNNLPKGTTIVLENLTDSDNPTYWYYNVDSEVKKIELEEFIAMGKTSGEHYELSNAIDLIDEKLLLIVDFSQCENAYLGEGTYNVKMDFVGKNDNVEDFSTDNLSFTTKARSIITLADIANVATGNEFNINYAVLLSEGAESKNEGRKLSLVLTAPDNIPADTNLTVEDTTYYLNSEKQFIIPLGDIEDTPEPIKAIINSNMLPKEDTEYEFEAELWVSATANAEAPKLGESVGTKTFNVTSDGDFTPSLKVEKINKRIIHKDELSETFVATYEYVAAEGCRVTVELQQKVGTAYTKVTDRLNQVNNTTVHNIGVFDLKAFDGENNIEFKLSSATQNSTYRLVLRVRDENGKQLLEVPYNFIVTD